MSTRRGRPPATPSSQSSSSTRTPTSRSTPSKRSEPAKPERPHSALLPTPLEAALLSVYPLTLLFGSLFTYLSPSLQPPTNESIYSVQHQSYFPPHLAPSYFATKRNVFNVYFVKRGWGWVSLALLLFTFGAARGRAACEIMIAGLGERFSWASPRISEIRDSAERREEQEARVRRRWQVLARWALATLAWLLVTQWCFGAPLVDRVYRVTGGACFRLLEKEFTTDSKTTEVIAGALSHAACRVAGGQWIGGYDVSGHVFLLVLASGMLWLEVLPVVLPGVRGLTGQRVVLTELDGEMMLHDTEEADGVYGDGPYQERMDEVEASRAAAAAVVVSQRQAAAEAEITPTTPPPPSPSHAYGTRSSTGSLRRDPTSPNTYKIVSSSGADKRAASRQQRQNHAGPLTRVRVAVTSLSVLIGVLSWWMLLMTAAFFHTWTEKALALVLAGSALWTVYLLPRGVPVARSWLGMPGV